MTYLIVPTVEDRQRLAEHAGQLARHQPGIPLPEPRFLQGDVVKRFDIQLTSGPTRLRQWSIGNSGSWPWRVDGMYAGEVDLTEGVAITAHGGVGEPVTVHIDLDDLVNPVV